MKEIKTFFGNDNRLNKGYTTIASPRKFDNSVYRKKFEHILPPIDVISEYENIHPGSLAKLIEMARSEQQHKHEIDRLAIDAYAKATKNGQIFALCAVCAICITALFLAFMGSITIAVVTIISFLVIGLAYFLANKKLFSKKVIENPKITKTPFHRKRPR